MLRGDAPPPDLQQQPILRRAPREIGDAATGPALRDGASPSAGWRQEGATRGTGTT